MSDDISRCLQEELHAVDLDNQYTVEETLRESEAGRTEKVRSADGAVFIRKYLRRGVTQANEYALLFGLQGATTPFPRIISLYELAEFQVVIMEYLDGPTLQECVEHYGPYEPQRALRWALGICEAVRILHTCSASPIIHRDIKPAHVILQDGHVKLIDFGIARTWKAGEKHDTEYLGTRGYAAPEQFGYSQTDVRTDVYACGATLYFLLTDEQFDAQRHTALESAPSPTVPTDLARIICRCTEFSPNARYQSVAELIAALQEVLRKMQIPPVPTAPVMPQAPVYQSAAVVVLRESTALQDPLKKHWTKDIIIGIFCWPFLIYGLVMPFTEYFWVYQKYGTLQFVMNALTYWIAMLLFVLPCYLLFANPLRVRDRIRFFAKNRKKRIVLIAAAFLGLAVICTMPVSSLQSSQVQAAIKAYQSAQNN